MAARTLVYMLTVVGFVSLFTLMAADDVPGLLGDTNTSVQNPQEVAACQSINSSIDGLNCAFDSAGTIFDRAGGLLQSPFTWFLLIIGIPFFLGIIYIGLTLIPGVG